MKKNLKIMGLLILIHVFYILCGLFLRHEGINLNLRWLYWNLLLAAIPVGFALVAYLLVKLFNHWELLSVGCSLGWLLFLPNACYMVTDLIHLNGSNLIGWNGTYLQNAAGWIVLMYIVAGIFMALVDGLFSTSLIHQNLKLNKLFDLIWIIVISGLVGYGVYIGRFLRLNSWDILKPRTLIHILVTNIDKFTILFSLLLGIFYFIAYLIFDKVIK